ARARKTDHAIVVSSSRRPRRVVLAKQDRSLLHVVPWFVPAGRSFVPARGCTGARRARAVKARRRDDVAAYASVPRPRLDGPEHGANIKQVGTLLHGSYRTRRRARYGERPRRCGRVCWQARSLARCGEAFSWLLRSTV